MNKQIHNQDANPAVFTEWATAAFRVGHSMINTLMGFVLTQFQSVLYNSIISYKLTII